MRALRRRILLRRFRKLKNPRRSKISKKISLPPRKKLQLSRRLLRKKNSQQPKIKKLMPKLKKLLKLFLIKRPKRLLNRR